MEADNHQYYSLITGASGGLGKALAVELARRKRNLFLVALPGTGLEYLCADLISLYGIKCFFFETNLLQDGSSDRIHHFARENEITVDFLINNVGVGQDGEIGSYSAEKIREIIMLNIMSATTLTNLFIDQLKSLPISYLLNVSSFTAYIPMPYKSIYQASKAYVYYFSQSLCIELQNTSVRVSVIMPGPMPTNKRVKDNIDKDGLSARMLTMTPEQVAKESLDRFFEGEKVIIPGKATKVLFGICNFLPYIVLRIMFRNFFKRPV